MRILFLLTALLVTPAAGHGQAGGTITLQGQMTISGGAYDVWGWVHPSTNREYALVGGRTSGLHIVDVSGPTNPIVTGVLPTVPGFDVKAFGSYAYTVDGNGSGNDGAIVDISVPSNPVLVGQFGSAHNIFIDDAGYMYLEFPGLRIYDLNPDPTNPTFLWSKFSSSGHDATVVGNRLYDFHGSDGTFIYDVSNRASPVLLGSITDPSIQFHHSGWTSKDENYLFVNDEGAAGGLPDFTVWDISNPAFPARVAQFDDPSATVHNSFRIGNFLYVAYYAAGFRVFDISDPTNPFLADEYDTSAFTGEIFVGAFGCYPFTPSGSIYLSDLQNGLFVFSFAPTPTGIREDTPRPFVLSQNYPNPFNPNTTISYELTTMVPVTLTIFDAAGRRIRTLLNEIQDAGVRHVTWDGRDGGGRPVASGVYFYELEAGGQMDTKRMTLLK